MVRLNAVKKVLEIKAEAEAVASMNLGIGYWGAAGGEPVLDALRVSGGGQGGYFRQPIARPFLLLSVGHVDCAEAARCFWYFDDAHANSAG